MNKTIFKNGDFDSLNRILDTVFRNRAYDHEFLTGEQVRTATVYRTTSDDGSIYAIEMPGCAKESIEVIFERGVISVKGTRTVIDTKAMFTTEFALDEWADVDEISTSYKDGILTIKVPKSEMMKSRKINIL